MAAQAPTMFDGMQERNITFCIDTSASMYLSLDTIKEHLIRYVLEKSVQATNANIIRYFNLINFSTEVYPWADRMVLWNSGTANAAVNWIKELAIKTGTNTLDALLLALQDADCNAISLVTDDLPDQDPYKILNQISLVSKGRPVHCVYISNQLAGKEDDRACIQFLQNLATITRGSFKIVSLTRQGSVDRIMPTCAFDPMSSLQLTNLTLNSDIDATKTGLIATQPGVQIVPGVPIGNSTIPLINTTVPMINTLPTVPYLHQTLPISAPMMQYPYPGWVIEPNTYKYPLHSYYPNVVVANTPQVPLKSVAWSRFSPVKVLKNGIVMAMDSSTVALDKNIAYTPDAANLLVGREIIARNAIDGFYYKGTVQSQILAHRFMIQFGPATHGKFKDTFYQDTAIYDIIHHNDAMRHPVQVDDKVLALIDGHEKYAPAIVLEGYEGRANPDAAKREYPLTVSFGNGKTATLAFNEAIWIPDAMYERIKFEYNLPHGARKYLEDHVDDYPLKSLPGYPATPLMNTKDAPECVIMPKMIYDIWPYYVPYFPQYNNLLYPTMAAPTRNFVPSVMPALNINEFQMPIGNNLVTAPQMYFRPLRANGASVNADDINRIVPGTLMTATQLDEKIKEQIAQHRHLLEHPCRHRSTSRCSGHRRSSSNCSETRRSCNRETRDFEHDTNGMVKSTCGKINYLVNELDNRIDRTKQETSHILHNLSDSIDGEIKKHDYLNCTHSRYKNEETRKYEYLYRNLINELYDEPKRSISYTEQRPRTVKFEDEVSESCSCCCSREDYQHELLSEAENSKSVNTDLSFAYGDNVQNNVGAHQRLRRMNSSFSSLDRFGNPKVSIGLPEKRLLKGRPSTATESIKSVNPYLKKSEVSLAIERDKELKNKVAELDRQENLRKEFRRNQISEIQNFERIKRELDEKKELLRANLRAKHSENIDERAAARRIDSDIQSQQKFNYLRHQREQRDYQQWRNEKETDFKDAAHLVFQKVQQEQTNKVYHNRMNLEDAMSGINLKQAQRRAAQQIKQNEIRESKGQKMAALNNDIKQDTKLKLRNEILAHF